MAVDLGLLVSIIALVVTVLVTVSGFAYRWGKRSESFLAHSRALEMRLDAVQADTREILLRLPKPDS